MRNAFVFLILITLSTSCERINPITSDVQVNWSDSIDKYGMSQLGLNLYLNQTDLNGRSCVNCHISPNGFDLVFFGKSDLKEQDSIIVQRAVFNPQTGHGHVSLEDAYHIAAYLRHLRTSLQIIPNDNASVLPVPAGVDPESVWDGISPLTEAQINSWDFRNDIATSFEFPKWFAGDESNAMSDDNTDFIPEIDLLSEKEGDVRVKFETYNTEPSNTNFLALMQAAHYALSEGERHPGEHNYYDFDKSFDYQRWMATLYFQHVIEPNNDFEFGDELSNNVASFSISDALWDAGNVARRSQDNGNGSQEIPNRLQNELSWLYLGWLTNYGARNSFETQYLGTALKDYGQEHLATLIILKSLISRSDNSPLIYADIFSLTYLAKNEWLYESMKFGTGYVLDGLNDSDPRFHLMNDDEVSVTINTLSHARQNISQNTTLSGTQKQELLPLIDSISSFVSAM